MRVLLIHNRYNPAVPSGENSVVDAQVAVLRNLGVDVQVFQPENAESVSPGFAADLLWRTRSKLLELVREFKPQVCHVHNLFPHIGHARLLSTIPSNVRVVQTVHNYRQRCPVGTFWRNGDECHSCELGRIAFQAVRNRCSNGSRVESTFLALQTTRGANEYLRRVDKFVAISDHIAGSLIRWGVDADKIVVVPNFAENLDHPVLPLRERHSDVVLFAGRLDSDKGYKLFSGAAQACADLGLDTRFEALGVGPLARGQSDGVVREVGMVSPAEVLSRLREVRAAVIPSRWAEPLGMTAIEALAGGTPIVVSDRGALPEIASGAGGLIVQPQLIPLVNAIRHLSYETESEWQLRSEKGRTVAEGRYSAQQFAQRLIATYDPTSYDSE